MNSSEYRKAVSCIFNHMTPNVLIMRFAYVALTVLAFVSFYKTVKKYFLVVHHRISHLSLVYAKKIQNTKLNLMCFIIRMNWVLTGSNTNILQSKWTASCVA